MVALEKEIDWGNQVHTLHVNYEEARSVVQSKILDLQSLFTPRSTVCCFTGPDNFRYEVWDRYKSNRYGARKPLCFAQLRDEILGGDFCDVIGRRHPRLEADDLLGILATKPGNESHVLVSRDKDFGTVPCIRYLGEAETLFGPGRTTIVTQEAADRFHLQQTLQGDTSDGYPGCPGVGEETAREMLEGGLRFVPRRHEILKGKRKGETEIRWEKTGGAKPWETVQSCYARAGLGEDDALTQARLARILRWEDWDNDKQEVKLWTPS